MTRKSFFKEPTTAEIKRDRKPLLIHPNEISPALDALVDNEYLLIQGSFIPEDFYSHRKFLKHAPEVKPKRMYSMQEAIQRKKFPYEDKREAVRDMDPKLSYVGFSFFPFSRDRRKRRILFTSDFEGAQVYAYSHQVGNPIIIRPYADARRVRLEGAEIIVEVPSRTIRRPRYRFKLTSVPVVNSQEKYCIAYNLGSTHYCGDKEFGSIRYRYETDKESSLVLNLCRHEAAAYFAIDDYFWTHLDVNGNPLHNKVPLNCGQFDIPTALALDLYKKIIARTLIQETQESKPRKLDRAERNVVIGILLRTHSYDPLFFPSTTIKGQGFIRDYDWNLV